MTFMACEPNKKNKIDNSGSVIENSEDLNTLIVNNRAKFVKITTSNLDSDYAKTQAIINWLTLNFDWKATDYKKRNVQQIIERGGGNCNDLAKVAMDLIEIANIKMRKVREINVHIKKERRKKDAEKKIEENGLRYSVFGKMHNDHVWIEVYDQKTQTWLPADPSLGLVGTKSWMNGRVVFEDRKTLDPRSEDMLVPMAIFVQDDEGNFLESRTEHYLVNTFNEIYDNKLYQLPSWEVWVDNLKMMDEKCLLAFQGKENLHNYETQIESLLKSYQSLHMEYNRREAGK